jgi:phthalate 4,5-dioxygenase oxygenase subunit
MLSTEDNELVTRVGPGTPMGSLMRQYWIPALRSSELPAPDSNPVRVLLLGEKLIAFRDTNGQVGLLANHCPHRGASLFFGRNEDCGLRCVYHGWKFDVAGNCVDMPNEPPESNFKHKVKAVAYPCRERGGVIWAYLGPRSEPPPLPDLEPNMLPEEDSYVGPISQECNWLQALEGDIDTSHVSFLHGGTTKLEDTTPGTFQHYMVKDRAPKYVAIDTDYGGTYGAYRPGPPGQQYWRIAHFLFPFHVMIPTGVLGSQVLVHSWVPMDDEHTMFWLMAKATSPNVIGARKLQFQPNSTDWYGRFRLVHNASNDYGLDRDRQRNGEWTGIPGIRTQDKAVVESMGPIRDRTAEHLGTADMMVIRIRRRLIGAARALAQKGETPPSVDHPDVYRIRSGGTFLPNDADWLQATEELRKAFVDHPELDLAVYDRGGS